MPNESISLTVSDSAEQRTVRLPRVPLDATVGEVVTDLTANWTSLPKNDTAGNPILYTPRLRREGRALLASETVRDSLEDGDEIQLQANIDAG